MNKEVTRVVNVDVAVAKGLMVSWYPVHPSTALHQLRETWSSWRFLLDVSFVQPVSSIKAQFGSRVAFDFAWIGFYCKSLMALLPVTFFIWLVDPWYQPVNPITCYSMSFAIWARMAANFWGREEAFFRTLFDDKTPTPHVPLPTFHGELQESPIDNNVKEKQYPKEWYFAKCFASSLVTLVFSLAVCLFVMAWMSIFEGELGMTANLCLIVQIKIFELTYNAVANKLIDWENHKFAPDLFSSYLWKQVVFQTVNNYSAYIFLLYQAAHGEHGCRVDCLSRLQTFGANMIVLLSLCSTADLVIRSAGVEYTLWREKRNLKNNITPGEVVPTRDCIEEQSKYATFRMRDQVDQMMPFVLALGNVLVFGAVAPFAVPVCFVACALHLRLSAFWITHYVQRSLPRKTQGIGAWGGVVSLQMAFGVILSGFILVNFGELFWGDKLITRLTGCLLFCFTIVVLLHIVDIVFPAKDGTAELLAARREYVERKVWTIAQDNKKARLEQEESKTHKFDTHADNLEEVLGCQWSEIAYFDRSVGRKGP